MNGKDPELAPTCQTSMGQAVPALRIRGVIDGIKKAGNKGHYNEGTDANYNSTQEINICSNDFAPALRMLGKVIVATLGGQCISRWPLTSNGGLACWNGLDLGSGAQCKANCMEKSDCNVTLRSVEGEDTDVPKCSAELFANPGNKSCNPCPCWRVVKKDDCKPDVDGTPFGLEILRTGEAPKGEQAVVKCATSPEKWSSPKFIKLPQCN
jgi:hypothetical protein